MIGLVVAAAAQTVVAPELSLRVGKQGARVPDRVECVVLACDQRPVVPLAYGLSVLTPSQLFVHARRTGFVGHRRDARPYAVDLRAGGWFDLGDRYDERIWVPRSELHAFAGLRYVHHTGDSDLLLDGYALQVGALAHYTADGLPEEVSAYVELTWLQYVQAAWSRHEPDRGRSGFVFRAGANAHALGLGVNVTADPGFGFSAMLELSVRAGLRVGG